ncbi:hypothetical protein Hbl1158_13195 [Halobaculum sp. CBA1158]|uniref:hypothetical protein n=1 Tax=Halobaculum sp. CBA1158 TaxID=2904243 RepID=UPI001F31EC5B|nr:hypothetical protein [Halobaculum sp. CBA1158]UIO99468.1 hypothetical protein Hbl1158_13195 [Halobaculum sp. CBA1158]
MRRRRVLEYGGAAGIGLLTGCAGLRSQLADERREPTPAETERRDDTPTPDPTPTATPEPTAPEPRFVVDDSGDGDYETLQEAYRVAQDGDVIGIESGSYEVTFGGDDLDIEKSLTLVGAGREETTVAIDGPQQEISMSGNAVDYWHVTVEPLRENGFVYSDASWSLSYATYNVPTRGWKGGAQIGTKIDAYETVFDAAPISSDSVSGVREDLSEFVLKIGILEAEDCTFRRPIDVQEVAVEDSRFTSPVRLRDSTSSFSGGEISNTRFDNGITIVNGSAGEFTIRRSEIRPDGDGTAVTASSGGGESSILNSTIFGRIVDGGDFGLARLEGNVFRAEEADIEFFIDGYGADRIVVNAFRDGDIRIQNGQPTVFDDERGLGNYYSAFDGTDDDDDGILDLPRPIPGDGDISDQYPLATDDPSEYL